MRNAQLQGASLQNAQLQGARLNLSHLEGATLRKAQVKGATLDFAILSGTTDLTETQLQGASLRETELQDVLLDSADLFSADLTSSYYSPKSFNDVNLTNVRCSDNEPVSKINLPPACRPSPQLPEAPRWVTTILGARVDDKVHSKALAEVLFRLVCSDQANSIDILRGILVNGRIEDTKDAAAKLVELIVSGSCPIAERLTPNDLAALKAGSPH